MATITNLTPHSVTVRTAAGDRTFPASGQVARVAVELIEARPVDDLPCSERRCGPVVGLLPVLDDDEVLIVIEHGFRRILARS